MATDTPTIVDPKDIDLAGHDVRARGEVLVFESARVDSSGPQMTIGLGAECRNCGVYTSGWVNKTETGYALDIEEPCQYPEGVPAFTSRVSFPSGEIAFADDLRFAVGDIGDNVKTSYNAAPGRYEVYREYEKQNIAYGFVSNSSPNIYLDVETGDIHVALPAFNDETDDFHPIQESWKFIGGICTDLWAYTIMDAQEFHARGVEVKDYGWMKKPEFAEVPAGTYEVTHYADLKGFDFYSSDLTIFATLRRIND